MFISTNLRVLVSHSKSWATLVGNNALQHMITAVEQLNNVTNSRQQ